MIVPGCIITSLFLLFFSALMIIPRTAAEEVQLWGKPLTIHGYISQGVGFGMAGEHFDTQRGFQSAIFQGLLEGVYEPRQDLRVFLSGKINADLAYQGLHDNASWQEKRFNESRDRLLIFDSTKDLLNEAHITWRPGSFYLRAGKQIVRWGETDGFRLMDQINPVDQRRGLADVEFENTIIPIWLLRTEYELQSLPAWCQKLSFQGIFNPNIQFRANDGIQPGNNRAGIWAPHATTYLGGVYPFDFAYLGSLDARIKEPHGTEGHEYALRAKATIHDATVTLNYYYGRDKDPVMRTAGPARVETSPYDGRMIIHPNVEGYYPIFRFAGATFTTDIDRLQSTALGGVAPVLRLESFYAFSNTFVANTGNSFERHDEISWAAGIDWKVMIPFLNQLSLFTISPQFYHRRIVGYPDGDRLIGTGGEPLRRNNYQSSLMISTAYMSNKLQPSFFWLRNMSEDADFYRLQVVYDWTHNWRCTVGTMVFYGAKEGKGFEVFSHKDQAYFSLSYRF
jgi:hypothetical protein